VAGPAAAEREVRVLRKLALEVVVPPYGSERFGVVVPPLVTVDLELREGDHCPLGDAVPVDGDLLAGFPEQHVRRRVQP
jgi:RNase P/RNase MRP subunit p29